MVQQNESYEFQPLGGELACFVSPKLTKSKVCVQISTETRNKIYYCIQLSKN